MPAPSETTGAELQAKIGKDFPRMRVLLVDRHSGARHTLRSILSTLGFTAIHNAATSTEVMRQATTSRRRTTPRTASNCWKSCANSTSSRCRRCSC